MQEALKKYANNDFENGDKDRKLANKLFDSSLLEMKSESGKMTQLYGEARNFGVIYNVFEQNINNIYQDESRKHIIKEVYNLIKNDKILNEQFKIYDMFEKPVGIENIKDFVNEATNLITHFDGKQIKESNEKLIKLIRDNKLDEYVSIPEETENLYEAIEYVILNKKTFDNVNKFIKAENVITEYIENSQKNSINENKEKFSFDKFKEDLDREETKINEDMNEEEKKLLNMFTDPKTNKKSIFENYKSETLNKIKGAMQISEENDREQWNKIYESVNSKTYSDKLTQNIINCAEMLEICSTIEE